MNSLEEQETPVQEFTEADEYPFVKGIVPGTLSGAEMLALLEKVARLKFGQSNTKTLVPARNTRTALSMFRPCERRRNNASTHDAPAHQTFG